MTLMPLNYHQLHITRPFNRFDQYINAFVAGFLVEYFMCLRVMCFHDILY